MLDIVVASLGYDVVVMVVLAAAAVVDSDVKLF